MVCSKCHSLSLRSPCLPIFKADIANGKKRKKSKNENIGNLENPEIEKFLNLKCWKTKKSKTWKIGKSKHQKIEKSKN